MNLLKTIGLMRWNKIDTGYWECVFVNVPFLVRYHPDERMDLFFCKGDKEYLLHCGSSKSIETAKSDVESFVLDHLAFYSAQVHRECLNANVMTWRKLKEQLDQIPEDQMDEVVRVLDSDWDWFGEPCIVKAEEDKYSLEINGHDTKYTEEEQCVPEVEKGHYYLTIEL